MERNKNQNENSIMEEAYNTPLGRLVAAYEESLKTPPVGTQETLKSSVAPMYEPTKKGEAPYTPTPSADEADEALKEMAVENAQPKEYDEEYAKKMVHEYLGNLDIKTPEVKGISINPSLSKEENYDTLDEDSVRKGEAQRALFDEYAKQKVGAGNLMSAEDLPSATTIGSGDLEEKVYSFGTETLPKSVVDEYLAAWNQDVLHEKRFKEDAEYRNDWMLRHTGKSEERYRNELADYFDAKLDELENNAWKDRPSLYRGLGYAQGAPANNNPIGLDKIKKAREVVNTLRKNNFGSGFAEGFDLGNILTLDLKDLGTNVALIKALNKDTRGEELNANEKALVDAWSITQDAEEAMETLGGRSWKANVGYGLAYSIGAIPQFAATQGIASAASKGISRAAAKVALKRAMNTATNKGIGSALKYGSLKVAESAVGNLARVPFAGSTYRNYTDKRLNQFQLEERLNEATGKIEKVIGKQETSALKDAIHSFVESYFEFQSEDFGQALDFGVKAFAKSLPRKNKLHQMAVSGLSGPVKGGIPRYLRETAKIGSIGAEVLEEAVNDVATNTLHQDDDGWKRMATWQYWWELACVSSMLSSGFGVINYASNTSERRKVKALMDIRERSLDNIDNEALRKHLNDASLLDDLTERSKMLANLDWGGELTREDMANAIDFINAQTKLDVIDYSASEAERLDRMTPYLERLSIAARDGEISDADVQRLAEEAYTRAFRVQENQQDLARIADRIRVATEAGISAKDINSIIANAGLKVYNVGDEVEMLDGTRGSVNRVLAGAYEVIDEDGDIEVYQFEEVLQPSPEVAEAQMANAEQTEGAEAQAEPTQQDVADKAVAEAVEAARAEADKIKNKDDEKVYTAKLEDGTEGYIINGKGLEIGSDGRIVKSDIGTVIFKPLEGEAMSVSTNEVRVTDATSVEDILNVAAESARAMAQSVAETQAQEDADFVAKTDDGKNVYILKGQGVEYDAESGEVRTPVQTYVKVRYEDGTEGEIHPEDLYDLEAVIAPAQQAEQTQVTEENSATEAPAEATQQEVQTSEQTVAQPNATPIPTLKNGRPDYNAMSPEMFAEQYTAAYGAEKTIKLAQANIADADKVIADLEKKQDSLIDPNKIDEVQVKLEQAKARKARYEAVLNIMNTPKAEPIATEAQNEVAEVEIQPTEEAQPQVEEAQTPEVEAVEDPKQGLRQRIAEWEDKLGVPVKVIERVEDIENAKARKAIESGVNITGWYDKNTNEVYFYLPNLVDTQEVDSTFVHEVVAHMGLEQMLGKETFGALCDRVWDMMSEKDRNTFLTYPGVNGDHRKAADEYIAHLAERTDLTAAETTIWQEIVNFIREAIAKIASDVQLTNEDIEDLIRASYRNLAATRLEAQGAQVDVEKGDVLFAVKDVLSGKEREKAIKDIMAVTGRSRDEVEKYLKAEESLAKVILDGDNVAFLDLQVDESVPSIWKNSDYPQGTVEFSNICRKRLPFTMIYQRLQKEFPNTVFDASTLETIRGVLKDNGVDVACGLCFVEDRRQLLGEIGQEFIDAVRGNHTTTNKKQISALKALKASGDTYIPVLYDLLTLDGMKALRETHPEVAAAFIRYNNARGMQAGRLFQAYSAYHREIRKFSKARVKSINDNGGLRIFSFSDFEAHHLIDLVQVLTDCASKGIKVQGYTKVPEFARAVKNTKMKVNRSLIAKDKGYVEDGYVPKNNEAVSPNAIGGKRLLLDTVEGINVNDENFFDSTDSPSIGNILVGINDEQIRLAMADPFVDYIIPFHTGIKKATLKQKGIGDWVNYKNYQVEKVMGANGKLKKAPTHINIYTDVLSDDITNEKQFVKRYLDVCREKGYVPKFPQFLKTNAKGEYVYTKGYYKFLIDFKLFNKSGRILPQEAVVPVFDNAFNKQILNKYVADEKAKAPNEEVYAEVKTALGLEDVSFRVKEREDIERKAKENGTWLKAPNGKDTNLTPEQWVTVRTKAFKNWFGDWENDPENSSIIVDDNGEPKVVYHGTYADFNTFDKSRLGSETDWNASSQALATTSHLGFWFAENKLNWYPKHKGVFLNMRDAYKFNSLEELAGSIEEYIGENDLVDETYQDIANSYVERLLSEEDGIIVLNDEETQTSSFVAFHPSQIKSAEGNTTFDSNNDDIRFRVVYHGSAADFDKFDKKFAGSGEGQAVMGAGHYVTTSEGTGRYYAETASNMRRKVVQEGGYTYNGEVVRSRYLVDAYLTLKKNNFDVDKAIEDVENGIAIIRRVKGESANTTSAEERLKLLKEEKAHKGTLGYQEEIVEQPTRHLYEVEIPDDNGKNYFDLDKKATKKTKDEAKRRMLEALYNGEESDYWKRNRDVIDDEWRYNVDSSSATNDAVRTMMEQFLTQEEVSDILSDMGYVGSKSKATDGTTYIIYKDEDLEIKENIRFRVTPEMDKMYMDAVESGNIGIADALVSSTAKKAGYTSPRLYSGSDAFGFTKIDTKKFSDDGISFWASDSEATASSYSANPNVRELQSDIDDEIDISEQIDDQIHTFRRLIDRTFSEWVFGQTNDSELRYLYDTSNFVEGRGDGVYDKFINIVYDTYYDYKDALENPFDDADAWFEKSEEGQKLMRSILTLEGLKRREYGLSYNPRGGVMQLYASTEGMIEIECNGKECDALRPKELPERERPYKTRDVVRWAKENGWKGVIFKNILDTGKYGGAEESDVYAFIDPFSQVKSADAVTYDDNGNVIPLSERFNNKESDLRFRVAYVEHAPYLDVQVDAKHRDFVAERLKRADTLDADALGSFASRMGKGVVLNEQRAKNAIFNKYRKEREAAVISYKALGDYSRKLLRAKYPDYKGNADNLAEGKSTLEVAKSLFEKYNTNEANAKLFDLIYPIAQRYGVRVEIELLPQIARYGESAAGKVTFDVHFLNSELEPDHQKASVILHELIHSVTQNAIYLVEEPEVQAVFGKPSDALVAAVENLKTVHQSILADEAFKGEYGLKNIHDVLAELSNPQFVAKLKQHKLFATFIDAIRRVVTAMFPDAIFEHSNAYEEVKTSLLDILNNTPVGLNESIIRNVWGEPSNVQFRVAPTFYSNAENAVKSIKQEKATPEQWLKMIEKNGGLKAGEDKWLRLSDWLKDSEKKTLTKQEVLDYINENQIQIEEVKYAEENSMVKTIKESPEFAALRKEYFDLKAEIKDEAETKLREKYGPDFDIAFSVFGDLFVKDDEAAAKLLGIPYESADLPIQGSRLIYSTQGLTNKREIALTVPTIEPWNEGDQIHFGDAGEGRAVAWIRFGETTDSDGKRVLVIDEIQSKRHQEGRERGYRVPDVDKYLKDNNVEVVETGEFYEFYRDGELDRKFSKGLLHYNIKEAKNLYVAGYNKSDIPAAPFEKNWHELAMKRMLRYAAENGYDAIAWTKGDQQAERYNIGSVVQRITSYEDGGNRMVIIRLNNNEPLNLKVDSEGKIVSSNREIGANTLSDVVGKELAVKIMNNEGEDATYYDGRDIPAKVIAGEGLRIGGEGMRGFYDQILPSFMNKYGKKWGVKVQDVTLPFVEEAGREMHSVDVTDAMRESVMEGQPMFRVGDIEVQEEHIKELEKTLKRRNKAIERLRKKMRDNKLETKEVAKEMSKVVRKTFEKELVENMGKRVFDGIIRLIETTDSRKDLERALLRIEDIALDLQLKEEMNRFEKFTNLRVQGESPRGVSVAANVDDRTRQMVTFVRENLDRPIDEVNAMVEAEGAILHEQLGAKVLTHRSEAMSYAYEIKDAEGEIASLIEENSRLRKERTALNAANKTEEAKVVGDQIKSNRSIIEAKKEEIVQLKRAQLYYLQAATDMLDESIKSGKESHKEWVESNLNHKKALINNVWKDIGNGDDIPILEEQEPIWKQKIDKIKNFLLSPAYSFNYLLKMISVNAANGEGGLYDHFVRGKYGYVESKEKYFTRYEAFKKELNDKAKEVFGKSYDKVLSDSNNPIDGSVTITYGKRKQEYAPTIGEVMYAYMVHKMPDGRQKLEQMGITEAKLQLLVDKIPAGYITLADWLQQEFLPSKREEYNNTHLEVFGTQMAQIENYVPLRVTKKFVYEEVDGAKVDQPKLPTTITGSIIKRKRNNLPLDLHTNALDLMLEHGQEMEHWNAFTRIVRDTNIFLSNTKIREALEHRNKGLHEKLKVAALIAYGSYAPRTDSTEEFVVLWSKMAASSKIAFRLNTALKQVLSYPAFYAYAASPKYWKYLTADAMPHRAISNFKWALDNIPSFQERWLQRMAGDERLAQKTKPWLDKWVKEMGRTGMYPNALVDAITCANGAHAVFRYEYERRVALGYSKEDALRLAKIDAALAINETQQSSEGLFLSRVQADRTFLSTVMSTFQNANFAYLRKQLEAVDELRRDIDTEIANRKKYLESQGLKMSQKEIEDAAIKQVAMAKKTAVIRLIVFGSLLTILWTIGNGVWKYAFGDDDEDDNWKTAIKDGFFISLTRNLYGGQIIEGLYSNYKTLNPSILIADLNAFISRIEDVISGKEVNVWDKTALYAALSTAIQFGGGVDINSFVSMTEGILGMIKDGANVEDVMLLLNAPRSQAKYIAGAPNEGETLDEYQKRQAWIERKIKSKIDKTELNKWAKNYQAYHDAKILGVPYHRDKFGRVVVPAIKDLDDQYKELLKELGLTKSGDYRNDVEPKQRNRKARATYRSGIRAVRKLEKALDDAVVFNEVYSENLRKMQQKKQEMVDIMTNNK